MTPYDDIQLRRIAITVMRHVVVAHQCANGSESYWDTETLESLVQMESCEYVEDTSPEHWLNLARAIRDDVLYLMEEEVLPL